MSGPSSQDPFASVMGHTRGADPDGSPSAAARFEEAGQPLNKVLRSLVTTLNADTPPGPSAGYEAILEAYIGAHAGDHELCFDHFELGHRDASGATVSQRALAVSLANVERTVVAWLVQSPDERRWTLFLQEAIDAWPVFEGTRVTPT